ncbi:MAG: TonB-dependent receptor [Melioribacteraceae bacterium]|nr:TonB-dependent receptor [Melioribacteraceae bacterium]
MMFYKVLLIIFVSYTSCFSQTNLGYIKGTVTDKVTKEPLPGVNLLIVGTTVGTASDENGHYIIKNIQVGSYRLRASAIGFESQIKTDIIVNSARPANINFELSEAVINLDGVVVSSEYFYSDPFEISSTASFSYEELRRSPGGFEDVIRALSLVPGVAQASAGRNDLVVRGGAPSENLFLVDGFVVPNINHFGGQGLTGGALCFVNLDFVNETSFSSGGFSSIYGDKLSSVLDVSLRHGREDRLGGKATISASQFGLNLEGPVSDKSNFIFSVRRSYLDFIFNAAGFGFVPEYWDGLAKYNYNFDAKNKLSALFIGAIDRVSFNNDNEDDIFDNARILGSNQNQYIAGVNFTHLSENSFYTVSLSQNYIDFDSEQRDTLLNPIFINKSTEIENEIKFNLVSKIASNSEINIGASAKLINFDTQIKLPNYKTTFGEDLYINNLKKKEDYYKYAAHIQYNDLFFNRIRISAGLRIDYFDAISNSTAFSPRFSASYLLDEITKINFSTGIYNQYPTYIWLAAVESNKNLNPVKVNQYILGFERQLRYDMKFKVEGFYKDYYDYPASKIRDYIVLSNTGSGYGGTTDNFASFGLEPLISEGIGNSRGVELSIQKKSSDSPSYGVMSLTYSKTEFTALDGVERTGAYDQKIIFNLAAGFIFSSKWEASFKFRYATGNPYTPFNVDGTQSIANYNNSRVDDTHSLDLRIDRFWDLGGMNLITYIDIQNVYNRKNSSQVRWDYKEKKVDEGSSIGLLPSIGVSLEF